MIEINQLSKWYPNGWALKDLTLQIEQGQIVGVLGLNGSGKSTFFKLLAGVIRPTQGHAKLNSLPVGIETRRTTAYLPEVDPYYTWMTVDEQLKFLADFYEGWDWNKTQDLLAVLGLDGKAQIGALSKGQKARIKIVAAFSWPSQLILMDEPLGGIDPPSRQRILDVLLGDYRSGQQTILLSTHLVGEVEEYLEQVIFLRSGTLALMGNADQMRQERSQSLSQIFAEVAL